MNRSPRMLLLVLCVVSLLLAPLYAQKTTGNIFGVVSDPSGAVVPNATITATNIATGASRTVNADQSGNYRFEIEPGVYKISAKAQGFKEIVVNNLEVHVSNTTNQNFTMQAGGSTETVEVTANPIQVQTDTASLGEVINDTQVKELPLNGRNFVELTQLTPGVSGANDFNSKDKGLTGGVNFSVNGNSITNNLFLVDGANNNDVGSNRTILIYPAVESISEFKMLRNSFGPEYGQASGSVISIVTKGGSNQLHGSVFYSGRNDALSAYDYFTKQQGSPKIPLRRNDYGFTVGGPVKKDKLFFFVSEEWNKEKRGIPGQASCVPTAAERAGDFSNPSCGATKPTIPVALQAVGNPYKFANPSPAGLLLAARFPDPNLAKPDANGNNWTNSGGRKQDWRQDSFRGDWQVSKNNTIMGRYTADHWSVPAPTAGLGWGDDPFPVLTSNWQQPSKMIVGKLTSTIGTSVVNDAEFAYSNNRINITVGGTDPGLLAKIDAAFKPLYPEDLKHSHLGLPVLWGSIGPYASTSSGNYWMQAPWSNSLDIYTFRDDLSKVAGSHTWKAGLFLGWDGKNEDINNPGQGERETFGSGDWATSIATHNDLANLLTPGAVWQLSETSTNIRGQMRWKDYEFYVGDTWKATKKLTVEYGARYSLLFTPYDNLNRGSSFQPFLYDPAKPAGDACNGIWVVPGTDPCTAANKVFGTKFSVAPGGPNKYLVNQNHHLIAPRLGVAWDPFGNGTTAIHAGVGQFFQRERVSPFFSFPNNAPYSLASGTINRTLDGPSAATAAALGGAASPSGGRSPDSTVPNSWQWNLSVEHSFAKDTALQLAYVGNRALHQTSSYDINRPDQSTWLQGAFLASGSAGFRALRPYSNFNELGYWNHAGSASYHSLQALFKTRYKRSQLTAAYTWSHSIADVLLDDSSGGATGRQAFTYWPNLDLDKGNSAINRPHIFVANWTYYLPEMKNMNSFVHAIVGGWELSGIQQASSGNSQSIYIGGLGERQQNLAAGQTSTVQSLVGLGRLDQLRPLVTGASCDGGRSGNKIFNPQAFTLIGWKLGTIPSNMAPRGYCAGPHLIETDFSLNKNWKLTEKVNMQFRLDAFNLFNHPNFVGNSMFQGNPFQGFNCGAPDANGKYQACSLTNNVVGGETRYNNFGLSSRLVGDAGREFQYSLKFSF